MAKKRKVKSVKTDKIKIGITLGFKDPMGSIWTNGINQNVLTFYHLLKNSNKNYDVCLLNVNKLDWSNRNDAFKGIDIFTFDEKYLDMDLIVCMGAQIHNSQIEKFKSISPNKKVISYKCGNNYVIAMENILFKEEPDKKPSQFQYEDGYDEIWYIPQQHETNYGFYKTLYRTNPIIVPFIWHNKFINQSLVEVETGFQNGNMKKGWKYEPKEEKSIGIMEPNLNIVKFSLLPTMIVEECYRSDIGKSKISKLMITNGEKVSSHPEFLGMIKTFDLYKDNKITSEGRYQTAWMVSQHLDVVVCHQLLNPLNYLYLDVAYMGYPVLHNAPMCKDIGYYYEGCDTEDGARVLSEILENHDNNIEEYRKRSALSLSRYHADNKELVETYDKLIYNLFNGGNSPELIYDATTNLYTNL